MTAVCGGYDCLVRTARHCPTCNRVRPMAGYVAAWYGTTLTCIGCGDTWTDGEQHPRPFQRGWRAKSIGRALEMWRGATPLRLVRVEVPS